MNNKCGEPFPELSTLSQIEKQPDTVAVDVKSSFDSAYSCIHVQKIKKRIKRGTQKGVKKKQSANKVMWRVMDNQLCKGCGKPMAENKAGMERTDTLNGSSSM